MPILAANKHLSSFMRRVLSIFQRQQYGCNTSKMDIEMVVSLRQKKILTKTKTKGVFHFEEITENASKKKWNT